MMDRCKHGLLKEQCTICMRGDVRPRLQGAHIKTDKAKAAKTK